MAQNFFGRGILIASGLILGIWLTGCNPTAPSGGSSENAQTNDRSSDQTEDNQAKKKVLTTFTVLG